MILILILCSLLFRCELSLGIQSYTRFWGMTMFGYYCIINVTVLLNLLIAMMNHSYQIISVSQWPLFHKAHQRRSGTFWALIIFPHLCLIYFVLLLSHFSCTVQEQADTEWKFARTKLWMSYFEDGGTVPVRRETRAKGWAARSYVTFLSSFLSSTCSLFQIPFNIIPTPKSFVYFFRWGFKKFFSRTKFAKNEAMKTVRVNKYLTIYCSTLLALHNWKQMAYMHVTNSENIGKL